MSDEKYDLMFSGQVVKGVDIQTAKSNVQKLFKIDAAKADVLFSGKTIALKKGLDFDAASKYRVVMKKAGILVNLEEVIDSAAASQLGSKLTNASPPASTSSSPLPGAKQSDVGGEPSTALGAQPNKPREEQPTIAAPDYGVAQQGGYLVNADEIDKPAPVTVDVSDWSVRENQGNLVDESELQQDPVADVAAPELDLAPVGSDVLKENERRQVDPVDVNTDALSLADPGERLGPESEKAPPPPKVDHISLAD